MYEPTTVVFDKTSPAEEAIPTIVQVDDPPSWNLNTRIDGGLAGTNQGVGLLRVNPFASSLWTSTNLSAAAPYPWQDRLHCALRSAS